MRKLWEELSTLDTNSQCTCLCNCDGKARMHKVEQDRRLIHFLMGLNEEEKQRKVKPHGKFNLEFTSLHVNVASTSVNFRTNYTPQRSNWGSSSGGSKPPNKSHLFCEYCKKYVHTRDKCYRLHGFPEDFKFTKCKNVAGTTTTAHAGREHMNNGKGHEGSEDRYGHEKKSPVISKQHLE
ncbi:hypothetical protein KY290_017079 [Solanum tuberosum]|uniref:Uncharacterized protein n=1 Tax=Solanum tuberosum TaxID=4113 RepID=A0ABQ7VAE1_SOLTU|nr:hypothetical protein KY290_017079 [Solanum tuberosum]